MKKSKSICFLIALTVLVSFAFFLHFTSKTQAASAIMTQAQNSQSSMQALGTSSSLSGTATIVNMGYLINFTGQSVQYDTGGNLSGYAWSNEYGWLDFNVGSPKINLTTGEMTGKARMLSLQNPNDTETPIDWADGWITFKGSNGGSGGGMTYGVTFNLTTGQGSGYAWGGNVIGWVDFSGVSITPAGEPSCTITANPETIIFDINSNQDSSLSWYGDNVSSPCTASGGWSGSKIVSSSPSIPVSTGTLSTTQTYNLSCPGTGGIIPSTPTCSKTVTVTSYPNCNSGDTLPQIPGTNCDIPNCPLCLLTVCPPGQVPDINGNCVSIILPPSCTDNELNGTSLIGGITVPVNWPCYCSIHQADTTPVDCVTFCLHNPSACKKKPRYIEN